MKNKFSLGNGVIFTPLDREKLLTTPESYSARVQLLNNSENESYNTRRVIGFQRNPDSKNEKYSHKNK